MDANKIEETYQQIMYGREEPDLAYLSGKTLKEFAAKIGEPVPNDSDGKPILDEEMYAMIRGEGIFLVE